MSRPLPLSARPLDPPDSVERPVPVEGAPAPGAPIPRHYAGCFACGDGEHGLHLRFVAGEDLSVTGELVVREAHQGAPGLIHGGVLAAAFDETFGALNEFVGETAVTGQLNTSYRRPVPVGSTVHLSARLEGREGRKLWMRATGRLDDPDGPLVAEASGLFVIVSPSHFAEHGSAVPDRSAVNP
ncbi:MAG: PaaI family thioesterase [Pseudonocardia sp.]|nr:PaaI family thioesterase [Pseudonocardia sp.]